MCACVYVRACIFVRVLVRPSPYACMWDFCVCMYLKALCNVTLLQSYIRLVQSALAQGNVPQAHHYARAAKFMCRANKPARAFLKKAFARFGELSTVGKCIYEYQLYTNMHFFL